MSAHAQGCGERKLHWGRQRIKRIVLGPSIFPHQCTLGLRDPQSEISVSFEDTGFSRDVTFRNVVAAGHPLVIGIGTDDRERPSIDTPSRPVLVFRERNANQQVLGRISLKWIDTLFVGTAQLRLFRVLHSENYCLPKPRLWIHYLYHRYQQWGSRARSTTSNIRISQRELHCLYTFYICPRQVVLVSVMDKGAGNIFPMDLIGSVGDDYFSLALHADSSPAPLMENSRRIALSDVPVDQTLLAYQLGKNHKKASVDWNDLAFETTNSPLFRLPVPRFSGRVREMEIETVRNMGSHKLFLARTIADHQSSDGLQLHFIHGFYQTWRHQAEHYAPSVKDGFRRTKKYVVSDSSGSSTRAL
jgi:hypothetical protein